MKRTLDMKANSPYIMRETQRLKSLNINTLSNVTKIHSYMFS